VFDSCAVCGIDTRAGGGRAFDSSTNLFNEAGRAQPVPDIEFPNGQEDDDTIPIFRASVCDAVDRISVYLNLTAASGKLQAPNPMQLELRVGLECQEEFATSVILSPPTYEDGGHLFTWATPQLFSSIVLTGTTIAAPNDPLQRVSLRLYLDRAGLCCAKNPILGKLTQPR